MKRIRHGTTDFSDLIFLCTDIRRCPAVPVDCIITMVKKHVLDGKFEKAYAESLHISE